MANPATENEEVPTRERILREASRLFARKGFHGTSTREIADAVEIRQPSLFHHFPTKRDIMAALIGLLARVRASPLPWTARERASSRGPASSTARCRSAS